MAPAPGPALTPLDREVGLFERERIYAACGGGPQRKLAYLSSSTIWVPLIPFDASDSVPLNELFAQSAVILKV